jgi:transposase-like protein
MFFRPPHCPNPVCQHFTGPSADFFINKGSYVTKHDRQHVPRYQCKACRKTFGSRGFSPTARQHKPAVNEQVANLLSSGVTLRRCAKILHLARVTVTRKFTWAARVARKKHAEALASGDIKSAYVQFDEMETFIGNKMRPLSIALAVRAKTGQIISARVAAMNCHGRLASKAMSLYGPRTDTRKRARTNVLKAVGSIARSSITVATDGNSAYGPVIKTVLPQAEHEVHIGGRKLQQQQPPQKEGRQPFDPLFKLNHTCAKIRADLSRMARRTWSTTKRMWALQYHLDLYIAYNNGYELG